MQRKTYWMSTHSCCTLSSYSMQVLNVSKFSPLLSGGTKRQGHTSQSSPSSACADPNSPAKANVNVAATTVADLAVVTKVLAKPRDGSCDFRIVQPVVSFSSLLLFFLKKGGGRWLPFHTQTQVCAVHQTVNLAEWCMPGNAMVRTDARPDTCEGKMCRSLEGGESVCVCHKTFSSPISLLPRNS